MGPLKEPVAADSGKGSEYLGKHTVKKEQISRFSQYIPVRYNDQVLPRNRSLGNKTVWILFESICITTFCA